VLAAAVKVATGAVALAVNDAVTPVGKLDAVKVIVPLNPDNAVILMVSVAVNPGVTVTEAELLLSEKSGNVLTTRVIATECVKVPEVPVTVT